MFFLLGPGEDLGELYKEEKLSSGQKSCGLDSDLRVKGCALLLVWEGAVWANLPNFVVVSVFLTRS